MLVLFKKGEALFQCVCETRSNDEACDRFDGLVRNAELDPDEVKLINACGDQLLRWRKGYDQYYRIDNYTGNTRCFATTLFSDRDMAERFATCMRSNLNPSFSKINVVDIRTGDNVHSWTRNA